eukprot:TRINITY_DN43647_c0_g1_i1.p3 TRINITY_DN43647_c0_g1~~TRINITY_DN43647_c0_g1_i1.p3  ORF type:complete len:137 (+),score=30.89 TRINITY_DN43647_c0_g1_i1:473-883(+)
MIDLTQETWRLIDTLPECTSAAGSSKRRRQSNAAPTVDPKRKRSKKETVKTGPSAVVWAKMTGHPWWPAKLFPEPEQTEAKHKYVFFFGTGQWGLLPDSAVQPFDREFVDKFIPKKGKTDGWERAVADASQMLGPP